MEKSKTWFTKKIIEDDIKIEDKSEPGAKEYDDSSEKNEISFSNNDNNKKKNWYNFMTNYSKKKLMEEIKNPERTKKWNPFFKKGTENKTDDKFNPMEEDYDSDSVYNNNKTIVDEEDKEDEMTSNDFINYLNTNGWKTEVVRVADVKKFFEDKEEQKIFNDIDKCQKVLSETLKNIGECVEGCEEVKKFLNRKRSNI